MKKLNFASDYVHGAHPEILRRLAETNLEGNPGYGTDDHCARAAARIRACCAAPEADVYFLVGGTQTNAAVIAGLLAPWQGVIAAASGHIAVHEAGAVELTGHKILSVPQKNGKLCVSDVEALLRHYETDASREHTVQPALIYVSQPTEAGTLYSKQELTALRALCDRYGLRLFLDGARLAYALGCPQNDVTLPDLAALCDAFYLGGTKCGALFGEAVVTPKRRTLPFFFTQMKQRGAVLAKGWLLGLQFEVLMEGDRYLELGRNGVEKADRLRQALRELDFPIYQPNPTNQVFTILTEDRAERLKEQVVYEIWDHLPDGRTAIRLAPGWATTDEDLDRLISILASL